MRLIDADAFAEFLQDTVKQHKYENIKIDELLTVADVIDAVISELDGTSFDGFKNAPTIEERKTGRWLSYEGHPLKTKEGCPVDEAYCSVCGGLLCASDEYMCTGLYCPNCGAKMEQTDGHELEET